MLGSQPHKNMDALEEYAEMSVSSIYYLILESSGIRDVHTDHVASHLGKAIGITTLLRGIMHNAQRSRVDLPQDLMIKHKISQESVARRVKTDAMKNMVLEIATIANVHLRLARSMKPDIPKSACSIFLPAVCCGQYLKKLEKYDFDIFHPKLLKRSSWLPLRLWVNKVYCKY